MYRSVAFCGHMPEICKFEVAGNISAPMSSLFFFFNKISNYIEILRKSMLPFSKIQKKIVILPENCNNGIKK